MCQVDARRVRPGRASRNGFAGFSTKRDGAVLRPLDLYIRPVPCSASSFAWPQTRRGRYDERRDRSAFHQAPEHGDRFVSGGGIVVMSARL